MKKSFFFFFGVLVALSFVGGCASLKASVVKEEAKKKAKAVGLNLASLKEGEACKYIGFIGDNSVAKAKANGNIKFMMFNYTGGNFLKKCTYAYGK